MERTLIPQEIRTLDICRDIEIMTEQLYLHYVDIFKSNKKFSALWQKTAKEERNHANQIILAAKMKTGVIESVDVDCGKAETMLEYVRALLEEARVSPPSPLDALRTAIGLEKSLFEFHMLSMATFTAEAHKKMFRAMMAFDKRHVEALEDVYHLLSKLSESSR